MLIRTYIYLAFKKLVILESLLTSISLVVAMVTPLGYRSSCVSTWHVTAEESLHTALIPCYLCLRNSLLESMILLGQLQGIKIFH